ncbi:serine phosphatase [Candidatus Koribacter versatilis Ellin345]|uniref:Serine phosphatase n=1 Tax=Koribacter versatilis (strain Ellin345) TaxID=204669 RepID=Q1IS13_KORVE|nr:SpoIIE family protein phosphatase [Candidatus Koribacter versatilis]ABF40337.1 serine phosphatase [Candidatus Koribacter versatilis Ellin345]
MKRSLLRDLQDRLILKGWYPQTKLARWTTYLVLIDLALWLIRRATKFFKPQSDFAGGWLTFFTLIVGCFALAWVLRWTKQHLLWRLRNRLLVTYVFIGAAPVILIGLMLFLAGWLFVGQFAADLASKDLNIELRRLTAANHTLMGGAKTLVRTGRIEQDYKDIVDRDIASREFPSRQVSLWYRGKGYLLQGSATDQPIAVPDHAKNGFAAITLADNMIFLRSVSRSKIGNDELTLVSSVPLNREMLANVAQNLGFLTVGPVPVGANGAPTQGSTVSYNQDGKEQTNFSFVEPERGLDALVQAGDVPTPAAWYDWKLTWGTFLSMTDWTDGKRRDGYISVQTRLFQLYSRLFEAIGKNASIFLTALSVIAVFLLVIELIALFIGLRLTRTITRSVAELYNATEHINKGDFHHRIQVRSKDQLAALEGAFNSMTTSIEALILEQKEKQKLESELAIAQEVQALLFPREVSQSESLEMHGVCRPARTVSGDYYDFLQLGHNQIGLAVGDISGKGISAALLMATVHAFVRAYTIEEALAEAKVGAAVGTQQLVFTASGDHLPPATLLALLNEQLFRSTPASKYATMFLGFYDGHRKRLTYSNAGHLPPFLVCADGSYRKLGDGGMVVGLFGGVSYENEHVELSSGDIIVAYSDGVTEPENEFGEFGEERLAQIVREHSSLPLPRIADAVITAVTDWIGGAEQPDDITVVLARAR